MLFILLPTKWFFRINITKYEKSLKIAKYSITSREIKKRSISEVMYLINCINSMDLNIYCNKYKKVVVYKLYSMYYIGIFYII